MEKTTVYRVEGAGLHGNRLPRDYKTLRGAEKAAKKLDRAYVFEYEVDENGRAERVRQH